MPTSNNIAAFFDLDDTILINTNSLYLYVKYLVRKKELSRWDLLKGVLLSSLHKLHLLNVEKLIDGLAKPYQGMSEQKIIDLTLEWFEIDVLPHISKEATEKITWHKTQGHKVVLLSTATQYVCQPIQQKLNMDDSINSVVHVKNGILTGTMQKPLCYEEGKVFYSREYAKIHNIDLKQSYFYTDSISDLPMLYEIGKPQVISPDPLLARKARKHGWPVSYWKQRINN